MARHLKITIASIASILALAIAGCSGGDDQTVESLPPETTEKDQGKKTEQFENPVVPQKQPTTAQAPPTLIQPTNPTERVGIVAKGRKDPFDEIIPPIKFAPRKPEDSTKDKAKKPVPKLPPLPGDRKAVGKRIASKPRPRRVAVRPRRSAVISVNTGGGGSTNSRNSNPGSGNNTRNRPSTGIRNGTGGGGTNGGGTNGGGIATNNVPAAKIPVSPDKLPSVVPPPELEAVLPPPPQPKLAQAVLVSGVVQVGSLSQAIIKVPSEPTSRYVQPGQRLSNGLLVKRIEMNEGSEPVVILEQYGIEVARMVGEVPAGATPATASTDNPVSTLPSLPESASVGAS
ncbi:MAG: hypothetical protein AAF630_01925 [Cyanobacteria bacterium P01_C01_bin.38]